MEKMFSIVNDISNFDNELKKNFFVIIKDYLIYYNEIVIIKKLLLVVYNYSKGKNIKTEMNKCINVLKFFDFLHKFIWNIGYMDIIQLKEELFMSDFRYTRDLCIKIKKINIQY